MPVRLPEELMVFWFELVENPWLNLQTILSGLLY